MKVIILAGGMGTRLQEETSVKPKPMVEIGNRPVLWHIMKIYSEVGFKEFVIALGYKGEWIKKYFLNYHHLDSDFTIRTKDGSIETHGGAQEDWLVHLIETGNDTMTGGRIRRLKDWVGNEPFMMTYGDGVADIDVKKLLAFHKQQGKLATMTVVRPESRFGGVRLKDGMIDHFIEKPQLGEGWINGGFFVLEPKVFDYIEGDTMSFEKEPIERLVAERQIAGFRHEDFWHPMDTLRDVKYLNELWASNRAPWKVWK